MRVQLPLIVLVIGIINITNTSRSSLSTHFLKKKLIAYKFLSKVEETLKLTFDTKTENVYTILDAKKESIEKLLPATYKDLPLQPFSNIYTILKKNLNKLLDLFKTVKALFPPTVKEKRESSPISTQEDCSFEINPLSETCATEILAFDNLLTQCKDLLKKNGINVSAAKSFSTGQAFTKLVFYIKFMNDLLVQWAQELNVFLEETYEIIGMKNIGNGFKARILESKCKKIKYTNILLVHIDYCRKENKQLTCNIILHIGKTSKVFFQMNPLTFSGCKLDLMFYVDEHFVPYTKICSSHNLDCFLKATFQTSPCLYSLYAQDIENIKQYCTFKLSNIEMEESYRGIVFHTLTKMQKNILNIQNIFPSSVPFYIENGEMKVKVNDDLELNYDFLPKRVVVVPTLGFNLTSQCNSPTLIFGLFPFSDFLPSSILLSTATVTSILAYLIFKLIRKYFHRRGRRHRRAQRRTGHLLLKQLHRESRRTRGN